MDELVGARLGAHAVGPSSAAGGRPVQPSPRTRDRGGEPLGIEESWDEQCPLQPGLVPGWGMSWWFAEQGITRDDRRAMSGEQCLALVCCYWREVTAGWWPDVEREAWVGPHHPFGNDDPTR